MDNTPPSPAQVTNEVSNQAKGFMGSILDFSFETFVTPQIIKLVYFLMLAGVVLSALVFFLGNLIKGGVVGVFVGLIGGPLILVLGAVGARVYVEIVMLAFKVLETLQRIEAKQK
ncbi:MAG TPA: DUF4282 domain-containing protein [Verrucomicrobiaceae bacterium]|jgi:hypothetical protein